MNIQCNKCGSTEFDTGYKCMKCGTQYKLYFQYSSTVKYAKQKESTPNVIAYIDDAVQYDNCLLEKEE